MERLIAVLTLLAADADQQIAALPDFVVVTDELALLFSDEVLVARPGASLMSASTWMAVEGLGASLTRMSAVPSLWNDGALRCATGVGPDPLGRPQHSGGTWSVHRAVPAGRAALRARPARPRLNSPRPATLEGASAADAPRLPARPRNPVERDAATADEPRLRTVMRAVHRNCGAMAQTGARFNIRHADGRGAQELFRLVGPFTARFVWEQPRRLRVVVGYGTKDDPAAWPEIEEQIAPYRELRYRDIRIRSTSRQFARPSG